MILANSFNDFSKSTHLTVCVKPKALISHNSCKNYIKSDRKTSSLVINYYNVLDQTSLKAAKYVNSIAVHQHSLKLCNDVTNSSWQKENIALWVTRKLPNQHTLPDGTPDEVIIYSVMVYRALFDRVTKTSLSTKPDEVLIYLTLFDRVTRKHPDQPTLMKS